jgi:hypothetical protein
MRPDSSRDRRIAIAIAAAAFVVYMANGRLIVEGDSVSARYLPIALSLHGTTFLDRWAPLVERVPPARPYSAPYWLMRSRSGHVVSAYPIVTPVLASPVYLAAAAGGLLPRDDDALARRARQLEKIAASLIASLAVLLFYRLVRRRCPAGAAALLSVAFAFGTSTWVIGSQALWQHGTAELLLVIGLLGATSENGVGGALVAGAAAGLLAVNRPPDGILSAAIVAFLSIRSPKRGVLASAAAIVFAVPFLVYNEVTFGALTGGYGALGLAGPHVFYSHPVFEGIAGLLASPGKGLLVFSPFLLFLARRAAPGREPDPTYGTLDALLATAILILIVFYARTDWRAGACYGPRFLTDAIPALVFLLAPVARSVRGQWRTLFAAAIAAAIAIEGVGAFCYPLGRSDDLYFPAGQSRLPIAHGVWVPRNAAFLVEARAGIAPPDLFERPAKGSP